MSRNDFRDRIMQTIFGSSVEDSDSDDEAIHMDIDGNGKAHVDGNGHGANVDAHIEGPVKGMRFDSLDDILKFYKEHANENGFDVRIRSNKKVDPKEYVIIICDRVTNRVLAFEILKGRVIHQG